MDQIRNQEDHQHQSKSRRFRIALPIIALLLLGLTGFSFAGAHGGFGSLAIGHQAHGVSGHQIHEAIGHLIEALDLNEQQQEELGGLHQILRDSMDGGHEAHQAHLRQLLQRVEEGHIDPEQARATVDHHLEQMRRNLHQLVDGMTSLINNLDEHQRQVLEDHLRHALEHLEEEATKSRGKEAHPHHLGSSNQHGHGSNP